MKINFVGNDYVAYVRNRTFPMLLFFGPLSIVILFMIVYQNNDMYGYMMVSPSLLLILFVVFYVPLVKRRKAMDSLVTEITIANEQIEIKTVNYLTKKEKTAVLDLNLTHIEFDTFFPLLKASKAHKITGTGKKNTNYYLVEDFYTQKGDRQAYDEIVAILKSPASRSLSN